MQTLYSVCAPWARSNGSVLKDDIIKKLVICRIFCELYLGKENAELFCIGGMMRKFRKTLGITVLALGLGLAGCGKKDDKDSGTEATTKTTESSSATEDETVDTTEGTEVVSSEETSGDTTESTSDNTTESTTENDDQELPSKYDPRPDKASAIRKQEWGDCWDFGGISTLESYLIKSGLADSDIDLSEEDVMWWANCGTEGGWTNRRRTDGGYAAMTVGYLITMGARAEADIPYFKDPGDDDAFADYFGESGNQRPENYDTAPVLYDVTNVIYFDDASPETIKSYIYNYGAITASYYDDRDGFNQETAAHFIPKKDDMTVPNHTISVVGWDDDYPAENFKEYDGKKPEKNGAWLIKNSYGQDFGSEGGYIYISYEDGYLFDNEEYNYMYAVCGARKHDDRKVYLHDEFGSIVSWTPVEGDKNTYANIYDFGEGETLTEVSFVTWAKGASYEVYYAPVDGDKPSADQTLWKSLVSGTVEYDGYITVMVDNEIEVPAGKGAIVLVLSGEKTAIGTDENKLMMGRPLYNAKTDKGTAYYMKDGEFTLAERQYNENDFEYTEEVNFCIRAYTVK